MEQIKNILIGPAFKNLREKQGLTQESLAKAAGIGRSTLVHLESGADVRLSKISAVANALGAALEAAAEPAALTERRQARLQQSLRTHSLQNAHLRIAIDLLLDDPAAIAALDDARKMVDLWEREQVCSAFYIHTWRQLLRGGPRDVGASMARIDKPWESALLQNSPFAAQLQAAT